MDLASQAGQSFAKTCRTARYDPPQMIVIVGTAGYDPPQINDWCSMFFVQRFDLLFVKSKDALDLCSLIIFIGLPEVKGGTRVAFKDEFRATEEREVLCEAQQGQNGVKRKLFGSFRNKIEALGVQDEECDLDGSRASTRHFQSEGLNMRQRRWMKLFSDYGCEIKYHMGKANIVVDVWIRKGGVKPRRVRDICRTIQAEISKKMLVNLDSYGRRKRNLIMEEVHATKYSVHLECETRTDLASQAGQSCAETYRTTGYDLPDMIVIVGMAGLSHLSFGTLNKLSKDGLARVPVVDAPRAIDLADSPVSTLIDQDAPSASTPSTQEQEHSPSISQGFEELPKTPTFHDAPLNESFHEDSTSQGSSSNVLQIKTPFEYLGRCTKDHPIAKMIRDPSRSIFTTKQLKTDIMWCYFDALLTSVEPNNFKQAMTKPS
nr:putative reverse transcriptase domain-containing protein [Tanacetum cinerariifolium]